MGQRNKKKGRKKVNKSSNGTNGNVVKTINGNNENFSREQMIEIHAEAYYRALKKIEEEKNNIDLSTVTKEKWYDKLLLGLNAFFFPWKINKRFYVNKYICDSILVLVVSGAFNFVGMLLWLLGMVSFGALVYQFFITGFVPAMIIILPVTVLLIVLGSMFTLAGKEFEKEVDSNRIYAYSASVLALVSCVIGIIALLK